MRIAIFSGAHQVPDSFAEKSQYLLDCCGGNTGNFAIISSLYWHLSAMAEQVDIVPWEVPVDRVKNDYDLVVFACANMLGIHTDLGGIAAKLELIGLPIIAIGLGAQADDLTKDIELSPGTRRWVDVLAAHAPSRHANIGVRGKYTLGQLDRLRLGERAVVTGCPSNFISPDPKLAGHLKRAWNSPSANRIAVAAGLPYWPELLTVERQLVKMVERTDGIYIGQHDIDMIRICRDEYEDIPKERLEHIQRYLAPEKSAQEFRNFCRRYAACFIDAGSWMEAIRKFDFVVGARFHGIMLAIQAGVPGAVITHDSRTQELCQTLAIPSKHYSAIKGGLNENNVRDMFEFDEHAYARTRSSLCVAYLKILGGAGLSPSAPLQAIRDAAPSIVAGTDRRQDPVIARTGAALLAS
jgi:Polysaccharide pyruvyl transferase